jgi:predicted lipoprotein with Yx(FWY)xxD motif
MTTESIPTARGRRATEPPLGVHRGLRRPLLGAVLAAIPAAVLLAACSSGGSTASQGGANGPMLSTGSISSIGTVLTDQSGLTVYEAQQEAGGKIMCTGSCLSFWSPVTVDKGVTPHGASSVTGKLGTIKRPDNGAIQLTVNGHPLYTFRQDSGPGSATGNDFRDSFGGQHFTWHALTAAGLAATAPASTPASTAPTSNPYGY